MNSSIKILLALLLTLITYLIGAQPNALKFDRISVSQGLSHVTVNCIYQDSFGLVWLGTSDGLNLYDGSDFTVFKPDDSDPKSIKSNIIHTIYEDANKNVWVGTFHGLYRFNRATKEFTRILNELKNQKIRAIIEKDNSTLWVGSNEGLFIIGINDSVPSKVPNLSSGILTLLQDKEQLWIGTSKGLIKYQDNNLESIPFCKECQITALAKDRFGTIWVGTDKFGLFKMTKKSLVPEPVYVSEKTEVLAIEIDQFNRLWIGTAENGVFLSADQGEHFSNYTFDKQNPYGISGNIIRSIHGDRLGRIWVGTWGNGFNIHDPEKSKFTNYRNGKDASTSLSHNFVHAVYETSDHLVLIGTKNGLNILNPETQRIQTIRTNSSNHLSSNYIKSIFQDSRGRLWIGTDKGLNRSKNNHFNPVFEKIHLEEGPQDNDITFVFEDASNRIWIGTWNGLYRYHENNQTTTKVIDHYQVLTIVEDNDGALWMGTYYYGLIKFDTATQEITNIEHQENQPTSLPNNRIWTLHKDTKGNIWAGTFGGGLSKLTNENGNVTFRTWKERDGISSNSIIGILEDQHGNLWISGNNGISKFNVESNTFANYYEKDGLQGNHFNVAYYTTSSGSMYFGGDRGLTAFHPDSLSNTTQNFPIINKFELFNKPVEINAQSALKQDILVTDELVLDHTQNIFSFGFSGLSYGNQNTHFAYRLKDFNNEWTIANHQRRYVTYTNIPAGDYTFELKLLDRSGKLAEATAIKYISILPAWWETWWFQILAMTSAIGLVFVLFRLRINQIKSQKEALEKSVIERTLELELSKKQVEDDKLIIEKSLAERESLLKEIHHRVKNNLQIIASLLYLQSGKFEDEDFKKVLEEGQGRVRSMALIHQKLYENDDLKSIPFGEYLQELVSEIRASFGMGKIQLNIEAENIFFDVDTAVPLGLIVNEMATNAFKYAFEKKESGSLSIYLTEENGMFTLNVRDDGKGIPDEIDIRKTKSLGLRLVRMLSQQLEGEFEFSNNNGTSFELKFAA